MKAWVSIEVPAGQLPEMRRDLSQYVSCLLHNHRWQLTSIKALWWLSSRETVPLQARRLQQCQLVTEFCSFYCRRDRFSPRLCAFGCHQNEDPEQEFREPRVRLQDCIEHGTK